MFFVGLGERGLWSSHEARAGQVAYMMAHEGHWCVPTLAQGQPTYDKPPLLYWCIAPLMKGIGVNAWAVRLPGAAAATVTVFLVYFFFAAELGAGGGLIAAVALATSVKFMAMGRIARTDTPLTLCVTAGLFFFYLGHIGRMRPVRAIVACAVAAAAAVMCKGPVGAAFVGLAALVYMGLTRSVGAYRGLVVPCILTGLIVFLGLVMPWFIAAHVATEGAFTQFFVFEEHFARSGVIDMANGYELRGNTPFFYLLHLLWGFFPWTFFAAGGIVEACRRAARPLPRAVLLALAWAATTFVFLSLILFKRADYLLPIYPAMAALVAFLFERVRRNAPTALRAFKVSAIVTGVFLLCIAGAAVTGYVSIRLGRVPPFVPVDRFNERDMAGFGAWMENIGFVQNLQVGAILALTILVGVYCLRAFRKPRAVLSALAGLFVVGALFYVSVVVPRIEARWSESDVAEAVIRETDGLPLVLFEYKSHELAFKATQLRRRGQPVVYSDKETATQTERAVGGRFMVITDRRRLDDVPDRWIAFPSFKEVPFARADEEDEDVFLWRVDLAAPAPASCPAPRVPNSRAVSTEGEPL